MWYFSWILGVSLACAVGIINAMWFEMRDEAQTNKDDEPTRPSGRKTR